LQLSLVSEPPLPTGARQAMHGLTAVTSTLGNLFNLKAIGFLYFGEGQCYSTER
jgi:hypothetical protein